MTQVIEDYADGSEKELKRVLGDLPKGRRVSLTFDGWTSANLTPFVAITAHYVSAEWKLCCRLLSFAELPGSHNAKNIGKHLYGVIRLYGLVNKVQSSQFYRYLNFTNFNCCS